MYASRYDPLLVSKERIPARANLAAWLQDALGYEQHYSRPSVI